MVTERVVPGRQVWRVGLVALVLVVLGCAMLPARTRADALDDQVRAIARQLRCPVCAGETVADSNAEISVQIRGIIRQKLEAGETPDQIKAYFVARYGESILAEPPPHGFTLGVWVAPVLVLLAGLAIVVAVLRGWLRHRPGQAVVATTTGIPTTDDERLERELDRFRREVVR